MVDFVDRVLPPECLRAIWALLHSSDLQAAMCVSSAWAHSAAPILYRHITIQATTSLQNLLRTVQHRPDLAGYVRSVCLGHSSRSLPVSAPNLLQQLPTLRELRAEGNWSGNLTDLLGHSPALKSLRFDRWCDVNDEKSLQDCHQLDQVLHGLHRTLEHLDLRIQLYSEDAEEVEGIRITPVRGNLCSLSQFTNLRTLRVPFAMLLGWTPEEAPEIGSLLPSSLRCLSLSEDLAMQCTYKLSEKFLVEKLDTFFTSLNHNEHALELVVFHPEEARGGWEDVTKQTIQDMATAAQVRCNIVEDASDDV